MSERGCSTAAAAAAAAADTYFGTCPMFGSSMESIEERGTPNTRPFRFF